MNASILILSAAAFHFRAGREDVAGIGQAFELLSPVLGSKAASTLFAVALLASGQVGSAVLTPCALRLSVRHGAVRICSSLPPSGPRADRSWKTRAGTAERSARLVSRPAFPPSIPEPGSAQRLGLASRLPPRSPRSQNSTLTGTLTGQIVMEGFLQMKIAPWKRRVATRLLAVAPAALTAGLAGDSALEGLLVFSQVFLSLTLSFAVVPLCHFTNSAGHMGPWRNGRTLSAAAWLIAVLIIGLNLYLIVQTALSGGDSV